MATNAELLQLMPAIFSPTSIEEYRISFRGENVTHTPIRTLRKRFDGHDILIAVNIDLAMPSAKFDIVEGLGETVKSVEVVDQELGKLIEFLRGKKAKIIVAIL